MRCVFHRVRIITPTLPMTVMLLFVIGNTPLEIMHVQIHDWFYHLPPLDRCGEIGEHVFLFEDIHRDLFEIASDLHDVEETRNYFPNLVGIDVLVSAAGVIFVENLYHHFYYTISKT